MSSHHIVKENQEPALMVASTGDLHEEYIGQLLEWSPTIFTSEDTIDYFQSRDIKVDVLISATDNLALQEDVKTLKLKDGFILDALEYLCGNNYKAVNIIAQTIHPKLVDYCTRINIVVFSGGKRNVFVVGSYEKWQVKGVKVSVKADAIESMKGLRAVGENEFETERDGFFSLRFKTADYIRVAEEL